MLSFSVGLLAGPGLEPGQLTPLPDSAFRPAIALAPALTHFFAGRPDVGGRIPRSRLRRRGRFRGTEIFLAVFVPFLSGGIILNVIREELPSDRESRFWAFAAGTAGYATLLLFI